MVYLALFLTFASVLFSSVDSSSTDPNNRQFHIQTDEGPERYFKYQTQNGQYRKEKRLEDGTVIGSYAWIDDNGFLRQRDYIADNQGYRILQNKNIYVGKHINVGDAVKAAKKSVSGKIPKPQYNNLQRGVLNPPNVYLPSKQYIPSSTPRPFFVPTTEYLPSTPSTPSSVYLPSTPSISSEYLPSSTLRPPVVSVSTPSVSISPPVYVESSTPPPISYLPPSSPQPFTSSTTPAPFVRITPPPLSKKYIPSSLSSNSIEYDEGQFTNPYINRNGPTYPIDNRGRFFNPIGNGYDPQYPYYDGISVTNDGFRYYIPRAYHEEQNVGGGVEKSGSFGYIDPFGIRRVVYYNAGPNGFKHRKNNRYVGFNATPYDPRPYRR